MTDDSLMPFGKHKGEKLANVSAEYLLWLQREWEADPPRGRDRQELLEYVKMNKEVLEMEMRNQRRRT